MIEEKLLNLFNANVEKEIIAHINFIVKTYNDNGFDCFLVGGPVRDLLLGLKPKDFDFTTNCPLEITKLLFDHVICTGEDHGTLTIHIDGENYEVTRFRRDVETDGRRATIKYSESVEEDLIRRDLTVNALAFDLVNVKIIDVSNGLKDLENKSLNFVGSTKDRIEEDHLRFIRLLRFKIKLGFSIDAKTIKDAKKVFNVKKLSLERIYDEFKKIFAFNLSNEDKEFLIASMVDVMNFDLTSYDKNKSNTILTEIVQTGSFFPIVLHNGWKEEYRLQKDLKKVLSAYDFFTKFNEVTPLTIKKLICYSDLDYDVVEQVLDMHGFYHKSYKIETFSVVKKIKQSCEPIVIKDLDIDGNDLKHMGFKGVELGKKLTYLLDLVHSRPELNTKSLLEQELLKTQQNQF